jgi:hypothetical protein
MKRAFVLAVALCAAFLFLGHAETWTQLDYLYEGTSTGWFVGADYVFETGAGSFAPYAGYHATLPTGDTVANFDLKLTVPDVNDPLAWDLDFGALWTGDAFGLTSTFAATLGSVIDLSGGWDSITFAIPDFALSLVTQLSPILRVRGEFDIGWNAGTSNLTIDRILIGARIGN